MKGSKTLGKTITAIVLSMMLIFSTVLPMTVMGSENNGGVKGGKLGSYRYYEVRSGETYDTIAEKNGISVSDIMTYNGLKYNDNLYVGQILKLPITTKNSDSKGIVSSQISIKAVQAKVADVISAIAFNAGYTVVYKGISDDQRVDVDIKKVTPLKAIDFVTRMADLSFVKDGNTIMVASASELNSTFADRIALTKLSFNYITYDELMTQASALGLNDIQIVSQASTKRDIWISTFPKQMAKLHELIGILDVKENISVGSSSIASAFTPLELDYISASEFSSLLGNLGLHTGITLPSQPMILYVYVSGRALQDIMMIKNVVDIPSPLANDETESTTVPQPTVPQPTESTTGEDLPTNPTEPTTGGILPTNPTEPTTGGILPTNPTEPTTGGVLPTNPTEPSSEEQPTLPAPLPTQPQDDSTPAPEEPITFQKYNLVNISRADAEGLISQYVKGISIYGHERMTKSLWLFGTAKAIEEAKSLISQIDSNVASASSTVHTYTTQNCSVEELMARFDKVKHENVEVHTYNHAAIGNSLIVYCDDITWNAEIHDLLVTLDTVDTGSDMWIPLESASKGTVDASEKVLNDRFNAMLTLYPEIFGNVKNKIVSISDGEETKSVMYVFTKSDKAKRMQDLMGAFDNA